MINKKEQKSQKQHNVCVKNTSLTEAGFFFLKFFRDGGLVWIEYMSDCKWQEIIANCVFVRAESDLNLC